ncbi:MAG TPA: aldo/keto reductase [Planctomycetota bacterium]|nr:aldo/keto reductase [Planctomycetota bacterium]
MERMRLGRTGLEIGRTGFGALPIQRVSFDEAASLLRRAHDAGVTFFDTARGYSDSEEKIGRALADVRDDVVIATKSWADDRTSLLEQLETSLRNMKTDYVDILQLHGPKTLPDPDDPESSWAGLTEAKRKGMIRFIGISNHRLSVAREAVLSGRFDTLQFPLSAISSPDDLALVELCREHDVGLIAMKALCGGLLTDAPAAFAFLRQFDNVVPIWGVQRMHELEQFLELEADPPTLDAGMRERIERDRVALSGDFCRGCGYCLPCPADIPIPMAARMAYLMRRAPTENFLTPEWREKMLRIETCTECGECRERCPYGLDAPALLVKMLDDYRGFLATQ